MGSRSHFVAILPHCHTLCTSLCLIISKILQAKSPFSSLLPLYYSNIIALFYKKLDIGNVCDGVMKVTLVMKVLNIKILENTNLVANKQ